MTTVLLLRHGRTTANAAGVLAGWTPGVQLDDAGTAQVAAVGERLAKVPLAAVVSSPLERCVQTSDAVAQGRDLQVQTDDRLGEARYARGWAGAFDITPDWMPILDESPLRGFFIAAGMSGHGFKLAPAVGEMMAALVSGDSGSLLGRGAWGEQGEMLLSGSVVDDVDGDGVPDAVFGL